MLENVTEIRRTVEEMDALTAPSVEALAATFAAMSRTVDTVTAECRDVMATLEGLRDALEMFGRSSGLGQELAGFGLVSLPLVGAVRMVKTAAGQYVRQQTGLPLSSWVDFVVSSSDEFESYLAELAEVAAVAQRHAAAGDRPLDPEQAAADEDLLLRARWKTQAWKQILGRVARLGQVVEAVLTIDLGGDAESPNDAAQGAPAGFAATVQRRIKEVQVRAAERPGDLRQWVLKPLADLRDRARRLPAQTAALAEQVSLLQVLLELEIAELRACLGEVSPAQVRIVGLRVAAGVRLPELARRLAEARAELATYQAYLARLESGRNGHDVAERAYPLLAREYREAEERCRADVAALEVQADVWRRSGPAVIDECAAWAALELDVLAARQYAEQREAPGERFALLSRERDRLDEVRAVLAAL